MLFSYNASNRCSMVRHLCPFVCCWSIFWLKAWRELVNSDSHYLWKTYPALHNFAGHSTPREGQSNPKTDSSYSKISPTMGMCLRGADNLSHSEHICRPQPCWAASFHLVRCFVFRGCASPLIGNRRCFCRAVLRDVKPIRFTCVLRIRILGLNGWSCRSHNRNCNDPLHILCVMCRRIQVSVFRHIRALLNFIPRWHWRAFLTGGGSAFWLLTYGLFYWASRLSLDSLSSVLLYLGYLFLLALLDFLVTGA